jgi:phospholipase/lecithinase/hemolysin
MTPLYSSSIPAVTPLAPSSLFIVWGGPDDFLSPSPLDLTGQAVADRAVSNIAAIVAGLQGLGAKNILVPGMPDLGLTPFKRLEGPVAAAQASALTDYFNARLMAALPAGVVFFDTSALLRTVVGDPAAYGFTNVADPCLNAAMPSLCSNPGQYLFWDDIHPSARGHEILAGQLAAAAVPEPATVGVVSCAVVVALLIRRRGTTHRRSAGNGANATAPNQAGGELELVRSDG